MFQRLRFPDSFKGIAFDFFNKCVDPPEDLLVGLLPIQVILPCMVGENQLHSISSLSVPFPSSSSTMDSIKRLVFFGERKR